MVKIVLISMMVAHIFGVASARGVQTPKFISKKNGLGKFFPGGVERTLTASVGMAMIAGAMLSPLDGVHLANAEPEQVDNGVDDDEWHRVTGDSPAHHRAVLRLGVKMKELEDFLGEPYGLTVAYLGGSENGGALLIGTRLSILGAEHEVGRAVHKGAEFSIFSHQGLESIDVELREVKLFPSLFESPAGAFDVVIAEVDTALPEEFTAVRLSSFPSPDTSLELVNYLREDDDLFVPRHRNCRAGKMDAAMFLGSHNCLAPMSFHAFGGAIFSAETRELVGFYLWRKAGDRLGRAEAIGFSPDIIAYTAELAEARAVSASEMLPTVWGKLKYKAD